MLFYGCFISLGFTPNGVFGNNLKTKYLTVHFFLGFGNTAFVFLDY